MIDTRLIPKPKNKKRFIKKNGNTQDIIDSIINVDKTYNHKELQKFSKQFNDDSGLKRLWKFIRYEIEYKRDDFDKSLHLTPPALWKKKQGDCKSKTLFVNAVLRCLKIPYIIRFTNYSKNEDQVKHVYTVAIINGKELPIDTVYNYFGKEKSYNKKIDYNMANIYEISGLGSSKNCTSQYDIKPNYVDPDVQKKYVEIQQRKKEIPEQEPIQFSQISEGQAILQIAKREIEIIQAYKPQKKDECRIALNLINKALKGDYSCTGNIPNSLSGLVNKIKGAEKFSTTRANDFGYNKLRDIQIDKLRKKCKHNVNAFPERYCLEKDLFINMFYSAGGIEYSRMHQDLLDGKITNFNQYIDYLSKQTQSQQQTGTDNYGFCISNTYIAQGFTSTFELPASSSLSSLFWFQPQGQAFTGTYQDFLNYIGNQNLVQSGDYYQAGNYIGRVLRQGDNAVFKYGYQSDYHQNYADRKLFFDDAMQRIQTAGLIHGVQPNDYGRYSVWFNNQADYQQAVKELNASSGVIDAFLNDTFNNNDSFGSALFYLFCQTSNININDFPPSVLSKLGVQNQYADATEYFSSVSQSTIYGLARNNILYTNGAEQPESTLDYLQNIYTGNANVNIEPATITAIVAGVVALIAAIADAVVRGEQAKQQSAVIDQTASDTANFGNLGSSNVLSENDWYPSSGTPPPPTNGSNGSGNNTMMLLGAGALAFAFLGGKDKKKKKK
jgi:hypothetical protein